MKGEMRNEILFGIFTQVVSLDDSSFAVTARKMVYLVGHLSGRQFTVQSTNWLTTSPPDSTGTVTFISLGYMYNTYQMYLYSEHPIEHVTKVARFMKETIIVNGEPLIETCPTASKGCFEDGEGERLNGDGDSTHSGQENSCFFREK